jgi:hypothetical protein
MAPRVATEEPDGIFALRAFIVKWWNRQWTVIVTQQ